MTRTLAVACLLVLIYALAMAANVQTPSCRGALLIIDVQKAWLTRDALTADGAWLPEKANTLADATRNEGIPVIFIIDVAYRHRFSAKQLELAPPLEALADDYVVEKRHPNGFQASQLEPLLRRLGVHTLLISGYATSECVKATLEGGLALGFDIVVVEDSHSGGLRGMRAAVWNTVWKGAGLQVVTSSEIDFAALRDPSAKEQGS